MNDNKLTVMDEARSRFVKLSMADPHEIPALDAELDEWLAQSQKHRDAYASVKGLHADAGALKGSGLHGQEMANLRSRSETMPQAASLNWSRYGAVAAVIVTALLVALAYRPTSAPDEGMNVAATQFERLATIRGEIREFRLADGSVATLDTDSRIEVSMTKQVRRLRLAQGRARLNVSEDARPFTVEAGSAEIVTKGANFDIQYQNSQSFDVQLISGNAQVRPAAQFASYRLTPQPLVVGKLTTLGTKDFQITTNGDTNDSRDWPGGWVESKSIRLDALIAMANKYADQPIKLERADVAALNVSGRFKISDTKGFVARICDLFNLTARREVNGIYLRKR